MRRMRILFVTPEPPYPPHSGGRILTCNSIRWLHQRHQVSVLSLYHTQQPPDIGPLREWCQAVHLFPARDKWHLPSILRAGLDPTRPYKALRFGQPDWRACFQQLAREQAFDLVHLQTFYPGEVVRDASVPVLHYKENVEGLLLRQLGQQSRNPLLRALARVESRRTLRYELAVARRSRRVLAISEADRQRLRQAGLNEMPLHVLRPFIDTQALRPMEPRADDPAFDIVFTGRMSYYPNTYGALWLCREVMPLVWSRCPDATLAIVGDRPPPTLQRAGRDARITVTGWVPDTAPFVRGAKVLAVPLNLGGGVRLKILEAAAQGKAMVSTGLGAEGLDFGPDDELRLADAPEAFASALCDLLEDPDQRHLLGRQARTRVENHYDFRQVLPELEAHYLDLLNE